MSKNSIVSIEGLKEIKLLSWLRYQFIFTKLLQIYKLLILVSLTFKIQMRELFNQTLKLKMRNWTFFCNMYSM